MSFALNLSLHLKYLSTLNSFIIVPINKIWTRVCKGVSFQIIPMADVEVRTLSITNVIFSILENF